MAERVRITDVAPRDGLQNEPGVIPTEDKVRLVEMLNETGVDEVEVSSFVSRKWVPQLGDAPEVFEQLAALKRPDVLFSALVPNEKGLQSALHVNERCGLKVVDKVALFTAASETFSQKNTNATIAETISRFEPVVREAVEAGLQLRGYVSCAFACPFEGETDPQRVAEVALRLDELGIHEIDLGDTIGAATPEAVARLVESVRSALSRDDQLMLTLHLHDTRGRAVECVRKALEVGVRSFDGSAGGLGGCPYASAGGARAPGNIATEALVEAVHEAGYETGVRLERIQRAAQFAHQLVETAREEADEALA